MLKLFVSLKNQPKTKEMMQQQLHKNKKKCHPKQSEGSNTTNHVTSSSKAYREVKFSNLQILLFSIFCSLFSILGYSQNYQWDWATYGGGNIGDNSWFYQSEQVYDIKIGTDGNYYFLASINKSTIGSAGSQLAGQPVTVYNNYGNSSLDMFLFSTTCDGKVRWSQAIGGGDMMLPTK